jgi:tRNA pseudouridine55 synthase
VKRLFGAAKVGHAGTLDPLATGHSADRARRRHQDRPVRPGRRKVYRFTVRWGIETDTDDAEGRSSPRPTRARPRRRSRRCCPRSPATSCSAAAFSALKVDGERAYDLARGGAPVALDERPVTIHRLASSNVPDADHAVLRGRDRQGHLRALARPRPRPRLGCLGHVTALRRLVVGPFDESSAVSIETLIAAREEGDARSLDRFLMPIGIALADLPRFRSEPMAPRASAAASRSSCAAAMRRCPRPPTPPMPAESWPSAKSPRARFIRSACSDG